MLFGGALTPAERQAAINYLNTDDSGVPGNYNSARIKETFSFLMGYAQFLEQTDRESAAVMGQLLATRNPD